MPVPHRNIPDCFSVTCFQTEEVRPLSVMDRSHINYNELNEISISQCMMSVLQKYNFLNNLQFYFWNVGLFCFISIIVIISLFSVTLNPPQISTVLQQTFHWVHSTPAGRFVEWGVTLRVIYTIRKTKKSGFSSEPMIETFQNFLALGDNYVILIQGTFKLMHLKIEYKT